VVTAYVVPLVHRKEALCDNLWTHLSALHEYKVYWSAVYWMQLSV
jgi:hypothetical protein